MQKQLVDAAKNGRSPRVVVVGAGFGGLEVAKALGKAGIDVTVVDRHNHHLFQPLLYQVATAALSAPDIAEPIRRILRPYPSVQVVFGEVAAIEASDRRLRLADGQSIAYTSLVLAAGARSSYFGHDDWQHHALGLKTIEDARRIRSRLLLGFECAERETDPAEQRRLMTIAVIGGGPTGVEVAGSIAELSRYTLARDFRNIRPQDTRIILVEAGPRVLPGFAPELSDYAQRRLDALGVVIETGRLVDHLGDGELGIGGERMPVGVVIWAAGVAASPLAATLGAPLDRSGRIIVPPTLEVPGFPDVYAIGDIAACPGDDGRPLPGLAQVAKQQGIHLGRGLAGLIRSGTPRLPFRYRSRGNTAIIGRHAAIFESGRTKIRGWFAWLAWAVIHVYLLVGFQHRLLVSIQWLWRYLTYEHGARLITTESAVEPRQTTGKR